MTGLMQNLKKTKDGKSMWESYLESHFWGGWHINNTKSFRLECLQNIKGFYGNKCWTTKFAIQHLFLSYWYMYMKYFLGTLNHHKMVLLLV